MTEHLIQWAACLHQELCIGVFVYSRTTGDAAVLDANKATAAAARDFHILTQDILVDLDEVPHRILSNTTDFLHERLRGSLSWGALHTEFRTGTFNRIARRIQLEQTFHE